MLNLFRRTPCALTAAKLQDARTNRAHGPVIRMLEWDLANLDNVIPALAGLAALDCGRSPEPGALRRHAFIRLH